MAAEPEKSTRRDFLSGRAAITAVDKLLGSAEDRPARPFHPAEPQPPLLHVGREAMACLFEIFFSPEKHPDGAEAALAALDEIDRLEAQLTIYRETSEVAALNRTAAEGPQPVETNLFQLLRSALELSQETDGAFDIAAGALSKVWGFYRRQGRMPSAEEISAALAVCGGRHLELDSAHSTLRFRQPGVELNLGAIGKGYALDRAGDLMREVGLSDFLFHGGSSSVLAAGARPGSNPANKAEAETTKEPPPPRGWLVGLRNPLRPEERLAEFELIDQALGTSGAGNQFFHHQGKRYGHILDPRSGWPAEKVLSSTVIAPTAALADALSTACYVLGEQGAREICARHADVSALLTRQQPGSSGLELIPINLPPSRWRDLRGA